MKHDYPDENIRKRSSNFIPYRLWFNKRIKHFFSIFISAFTYHNIFQIYIVWTEKKSPKQTFSFALSYKNFDWFIGIIWNSTRLLFDVQFISIDNYMKSDTRFEMCRSSSVQITSRNIPAAFRVVYLPFLFV